MPSQPGGRIGPAEDRTFPPQGGKCHQYLLPGTGTGDAGQGMVPRCGIAEIKSGKQNARQARRKTGRLDTGVAMEGEYLRQKTGHLYRKAGDVKSPG